MAISCDSRGKYIGAKLHLDEEECRELLDICPDYVREFLDEFHDDGPWPKDPLQSVCDFFHDSGPAHAAWHGMRIVKKIIKAIHKAVDADPSMLTPRTPAQIEAELIEEGKKSAKKLAKAGAGLAWNDKADPTAHLVVFPSGKVQLHHRSVFGEWDSWGVFLSEAAIPIAGVKIHPLVKEAS